MIVVNGVLLQLLEPLRLGASHLSAGMQKEPQNIQMYAALAGNFGCCFIGERDSISTHLIRILGSSFSFVKTRIFRCSFNSTAATVPKRQSLTNQLEAHKRRKGKGLPIHRHQPLSTHTF